MIEVPLLEIERFAIHDGPGIRSVVFLKGCPLHCPWCANPESQKFAPEKILRDGELRWVGKPVSVDELMSVLRRDAEYYRNSGGGITLSGGEAMAHRTVSACILSRCKEMGWHTAVETSGAVADDAFRELMPYVDLFLFDIKHTDARALRDVTGADLGMVLENLKMLVNAGKELILRLPCIPDFNFCEEHFRKVFGLASNLGIRRLDLLPYHVLGLEKYRQLGLPYNYPCTEGLDFNLLSPYVELGQSMGLDVRVDA